MKAIQLFFSKLRGQKSPYEFFTRIRKASTMTQRIGYGMMRYMTIEMWQHNLIFGEPRTSRVMD